MKPRAAALAAALLTAGAVAGSATVSGAAVSDHDRLIALENWAISKGYVPPADPTPSPTATPAQTSPAGLPGTWRMTFDDEFTGTAVDTSKWVTHDGWTHQNGVTTLAANVTVSGGAARLVLSDGTHGAALATEGSPGNYALPVGGVVEARVYFPGASGACWNWPAWWASGPGWPDAGEHDIAEVLGTALTVNYHSPSGAHNTGAPAGAWCGGWHTYALHRKAGTTDVLWDGRIVRTYPTDDNGAPEGLLLSHGANGTPHTGPGNALLVDYARAWSPA